MDQGEEGGVQAGTGEWGIGDGDGLLQDKLNGQ